ncbi:hypothetical protein GL4_1690 [Methyloceanibacter caenitepidi]|uniref:Uncharacterized protein n=1 Tax=Methyloceanibacter caenitepidi TaxID=1384459 RepID=A0A0A8K552_9HYPH|nr:hypothetical protein GL4_1690 [Methyloceanibacter caenitepidi]
MRWRPNVPSLFYVRKMFSHPVANLRGGPGKAAGKALRGFP